MILKILNVYIINGYLLLNHFQSKPGGLHRRNTVLFLAKLKGTDRGHKLIKKVFAKAIKQLKDRPTPS